jgi:hypothetical protein
MFKKGRHSTPEYGLLVDVCVPLSLVHSQPEPKNLLCVICCTLTETLLLVLDRELYGEPVAFESMWSIDSISLEEIALTNYEQACRI